MFWVTRRSLGNPKNSGYLKCKILIFGVNTKSLAKSAKLQVISIVWYDKQNYGVYLTDMFVKLYDNYVFDDLPKYLS